MANIFKFGGNLIWRMGNIFKFGGFLPNPPKFLPLRYMAALQSKPLHTFLFLIQQKSLSFSIEIIGNRKKFRTKKIGKPPSIANSQCKGKMLAKKLKNLGNDPKIYACIYKWKTSHSVLPTPFMRVGGIPDQILQTIF